MFVMLQLFCVISAVVSCESAKILAVYPIPSISHQVVFRPLMQELAKRGHEVVVITPDPVFPKGQSPQNLTEIDVHQLSYKIWNDFLKKGQVQTHLSGIVVTSMLEIIRTVFEAQIKSREVQKLINDKDKKFDLLFVESCVRPALSFAYLYNVPVIEFSSLGGVFGTFDETGVPTNSLFYPLPMRRRIHNLSFWEKISELYNEYGIQNVIEKSEEADNAMIRSVFGPEVPNLSKLKKNVHMIFLNVHPIWDFNRPVSPNILYLGGIHQKPIKELPKIVEGNPKLSDRDFVYGYFSYIFMETNLDLKNYLDSSKNGVIYVSFGTNARPSLLPPEKLRIFSNVFSQLPYDILWKWDEDELPGQPKNVKISKWFPQSDLLKHPNVRLFITQGGLQSTDEALTAGVPLVVVPFLGDQWFNAEQYVKLNIGIQLDLETITEDNFRNAINTIIENKTYRENVVKLHNMMRDQPQSPLERAVWWTEYVLRHGGATQLRSAAAHAHWTEYYALDLILFGLAVCIALFIATVFVIRLVLLKLKFSDLKIKIKTK